MPVKSNITMNTVDASLPNGDCLLAMSGGADSTLLLFLIGMTNPHRLIDVACCDVSLKGGNADRVRKIIEYVEEKLGYKVVNQLHVVDVPPGDKPNEYLRKFAASKNADDFTFITGVTKAPPESAVVTSSDDQMVNLYETCSEPERIFKTDKLTRCIVTWSTTGNARINLMAPMINYDKLTVYSLYQELDILDIYNLTRSCESSSPEETDNFTKPCNLGGDWWCMERQWAEEEYQRLIKEK